MDNNRISKIFLAIIFLYFFITGCGQSIKLGLIEVGKNSAVQEFYVDNYKMQVRIILMSDEKEYLYSFSLFTKNDGTPIKDVKSYLDIKKYDTMARYHYRYMRQKQPYISGLELVYDSTANNYEYKYKFKSKGKYELTIRLSEIEGKPLTKDILISFDQDVM